MLAQDTINGTAQVVPCGSNGVTLFIPAGVTVTAGLTAALLASAPLTLPGTCTCNWNHPEGCVVTTSGAIGVLTY